MKNLKTQQVEGIFVVEFFTNSILDQTQIESISKELFSIADKAAYSRLLVDLQNIEFMSSALIGVFIRFKMRVSKSGSELKLCSALEYLVELLKVTNLDNVFDIHETRREAINAFQSVLG